ncbi:MAG: flagellar biosynthetic protein FliO [Treponematales bacterium]
MKHKAFCAGCAAAALLLLVPAGIPAQAAVGEEAIIIEDSPGVPAAGGGGAGWVVFRMVLVLALAALAVYGVVFFIKRLTRAPEARDPHLKVLARVPLGPNISAAVLSAGGRAWLVGVSDGGVSLIAEITDQEVLAAMLVDDARRAEETGTARFGDFMSLLRRFGGGGTGGDKGDVLGAHAESLRNKRKRLGGV